MKPRELVLLFSLAAVWGASFLFMRVTASALNPFVTIELRVSLATAALLLYAMVIRHRPAIFQLWKQFLLIGAINAAVPFVLISSAEIHLSASLAAILNAMTPVFTALAAWLWTQEPLRMKKIIGLVTGIAGVIILVGWNPQAMGSEELISALFSLLAALFYGVAGIYIGRNFKGVNPLDLAIGQQAGASLLLLPFFLVYMPSELPSGSVILSVVGLAILSTSFGYLLFFALVNSAGAVKTLSVTFLVPVFGTLWGILFLQESLYLNTGLGMLIIFTSIVFVTDLSLHKSVADLPITSKKVQN